MKRALAAILAQCALVTASGPATASDPFVDAAGMVPGLAIEMRYAGANNFIGRPIAGYEAPRCLLTPAAARALGNAQAALASRGLGLKVFDCYRPLRAVADFAAWAGDLADTRMKSTFYPDTDKRDLFRLGYIARHSAHSRGSTVDLTLIRLSGGQELDMGTPFDWFGPASAPGSRLVGPAQSAHRSTLRQAMLRAGFRPNSQEWWHFTLVREPFPSTSYDSPVR